MLMLHGLQPSTYQLHIPRHMMSTLMLRLNHWTASSTLAPLWQLSNDTSSAEPKSNLPYGKYDEATCHPDKNDVHCWVGHG